MNDLQCFVCKKDLGNISANIFSTQSMYSDTLIYRFIEIFMNLSPNDLLQLHDNDPESHRVCPDCNSKINQYDQGITMAEKAQDELTRLLSSTQIEFETALEEENNYTPGNVGKIEVLEDDEVFDLEEINESGEEPEELLEAETVTSSNKKRSRTSTGSRNFKRKYEKKIKEGFSCDLCGVTFKSSNDINEHLSTHEGLSPLQCPTCHKSFKQKAALHRHMNLHTGETPYHCKICQKRFKHYSSFHMHQLVHEGVKDKKCEECGSMFLSNSHLRRHLRTHSGEKPFRCEICHQRFAQRYNMTTHMKGHQGLSRRSLKKIKQENDSKSKDHDSMDTIEEHLDTESWEEL